MPALSPKSVLEGRSTDRIPLPFILGLIVCGVCSLLALTYYVLVGGVHTTVVSGLLALPTVVVLVALVLLIDRLEPEPRVLLVLAFAWGAGVAIVGSFIVNTLSGSMLLPLYGERLAGVLTASVVAPVVEESFKGFFLLLMLWFRRFEIDGPTDGLVYAALCALGFAFVENVLYYQNGLLDDGGGVAAIVLVRGVIAPLGHPIYTAMTGLAVAHAARSRGAGRGLVVVLGWFAAVLLHALWNFASVFGYGGLAIAYLIQLGVLAGLIAIVLRDRRRLVGLIATHLPPYIPSGLVHADDVRMLATMAGRKQARQWAVAQAGLPGMRAMSDYQLAATELALLHDHAMRATIPVPMFHARRDAILWLMRVARDAFFRRRPQPQVAPPPWAGAEQSGFFRTAELRTTRMPVYRPVPPAPGAGPPGRGVPRPAGMPPTPPPGTPRPGQQPQDQMTRRLRRPPEGSRGQPGPQQQGFPPGQQPPPNQQPPR
ncbi:PrsW family intramembrane metalloprotease [Saccharopolyspora sp. MS10]|uniref:PrsW family intramembrane metalloprotease n=1 Tax=Saccharopolyspora sp. MS10 TaxID=3385973 RepID=UPI0039A0534C